jgi:hypothetical protein
MCDAVLCLLRHGDEVVAMFFSETRTFVGSRFSGCGFLLVYIGFVGDPCYERPGGSQPKVGGLPDGDDVAVRRPGDEFTGGFEGTLRAARSVVAE